MKGKRLSIFMSISLLATMLPVASVFADTLAPASTYGVEYVGHVQNIGWQNPVSTIGYQYSQDMSDVNEAGTDGKGLRVEALKITGVNLPQGASITYKAHVQNKGWLDAVTTSGNTAIDDAPEGGTHGLGLRVEAFKMTLNGMPGYSIKYQTHVQNKGWMTPVQTENGTNIETATEAGTDGQGLRMEALRIEIVKTDSVVTFKDASLEQIVRTTINKKTGTLHQSDVAGITALPATYLGITDLSGIENLVGLKTLDLSINKISDISPLKGLTNLTFVNLEGNSITDLTPLKGLTNLTEVILAFNGITDISPLSALPSLNDIEASSNDISDISPLKGLTNLTTIDLARNKISDISPLSSLSNLQSFSLNNNVISDISPLKGLAALKWFNLDDNKISDISPLKGLTSLKSISLDDNEISDISSLSSLTNMDSVDLTNNKISDISPLKGLSALTRISVNGNEISDISPLKSLTNLTFAFLINNKISDADMQALQKALPNCNIPLN